MEHPKAYEILLFETRDGLWKARIRSNDLIAHSIYSVACASRVDALADVLLRFDLEMYKVIDKTLEK